MSPRRFAPALVLATALTGLSLLPREAAAAEFHFRQVFCGQQHLGTMFVNKDTYKASTVTRNRAGALVAKENWLGA